MCMLAGGSAVNTVTLLGYVALLVAWSVAVFLLSWRQRVLSRAWSAIKRAFSALRSTKKTDADDEVSALVQEKMREMTVEHVRWFCQGLALTCAPFVCIVVFKLAMCSSRWMTPAQDVAVMLVFGVTTLVLLFPWVILPKTMDAAYAVLVACGALFVAPMFMSAEDSCTAHFLIVGVFDITLNVARRPSIKVGSMNLLIAMSAIAAHVLGDNDDVSAAPWTVAIMHVAWSFVLPVGLARLLDASMSAAMRKGLESRVTGELLSAAEALLRSCCDVVVELDDAGTIIGPAKDLAGFMLMQPGKDLQGSSFPDLMSCDKDRAAFLRHLRLQPPSDTTSMADALHVSLCDVQRNELSVELLSFKFHRLTGQPLYMVGLREFDDKKASSQRGPPCPQRWRPKLDDADGAQGQGEGHEGATRLQIGNDRDDEETSGPVRTDSGSIGSLTSSMAARQAMVVVVDCSMDGFPVRGYSAAFRQSMGRVGLGTRLMNLVQGDKAPFVQWVQLAINADAAGNTEFPDQFVTIETRRGRLSGMCRLLPEENKDQYDLRHSQLLFYDVSVDEQCQRQASSAADGLLGGVARFSASL